METFILLRVAWSATYTYILLLFVAASFVAYVSRPRQRGEVVKKLFAGELLPLEASDNPSETPRVTVNCGEGGKVTFTRIGVKGLTASGAVSLAVSFNGKDVEILERDTFGYPGDSPMLGAKFEIDMSGYEWRHIKWSDEDSGLWCAFTLHVREGISFEVPLKR